MQASSSSSSESSRSGSPFSRATTPSSHIAATYVYVHSDVLTPSALETLFERHASCDCMGLIIDNASSSDRSSFVYAAGEDEWVKTISDTQDIEYLTSSTYQAPAHLTLHLFSLAALRAVLSLPLSTSLTLHTLERPTFVYKPLSYTTKHSLQPLRRPHPRRRPHGQHPNLAEWDTLWASWDAVTLRMIPEGMLHQKPIDLRHKCLFYIGHIPTFLISTEPKWFWNIFERGIDPHVDDPDHCHNHSEVPTNDEDWPSLAEVLVFRDGHEGFHVETLLYMLIQKAGCGGTLPPPGFVVPPWEDLAAQWRSPPPRRAQPSLSPARSVEVGAFRASWRCVTNGEFAAFRRANKGSVELPRSWVRLGDGDDDDDDGNIHVRTLFGFVPLRIAADWPVLTSYDALAAYAKAQGGRLPTEPELRLFLDLYDVGHAGGANVGFRNWHPTPGTMGLEAQSGKGTNGGVWDHEGLVPTELFTGYSADFFDGKHQVSHNYPYPWIGARVVYDV
ncbi:DUF323 domain-containing protein [Pholiota molesta]|nr:DUF323 domain-containing protein [Pholiota molesta]